VYYQNGGESDAQAAEELGQWNEKRGLPGEGLLTEINIVFVDPDGSRSATCTPISQLGPAKSA
jgi:hypothetical protein